MKSTVLTIAYSDLNSLHAHAAPPATYGVVVVAYRLADASARAGGPVAAPVTEVATALGVAPAAVPALARPACEVGLISIDGDLVRVADRVAYRARGPADLDAVRAANRAHQVASRARRGAGAKPSPRARSAAARVSAYVEQASETCVRADVESDDCPRSRGAPVGERVAAAHAAAREMGDVTVDGIASSPWLTDYAGVLGFMAWAYSAHGEVPPDLWEMTRQSNKLLNSLRKSWPDRWRTELAAWILDLRTGEQELPNSPRYALDPGWLRRRRARRAEAAELHSALEDPTRWDAWRRGDDVTALDGIGDQELAVLVARVLTNWYGDGRKWGSGVLDAVAALVATPGVKWSAQAVLAYAGWRVAVDLPAYCETVAETNSWHLTGALIYARTASERRRLPRIPIEVVLDPAHTAAWRRAGYPRPDLRK